MTRDNQPNTDDSVNAQRGVSPAPPPSQPPSPRPVPRAVLCPFCGEVSKAHKRCSSCGGRFDHLSRQATQNAMGPWQVRDPAQPFRPGCSFEVIQSMVSRGKIVPTTVLRGPTTRQFWTPAKRVPSVANLLGACHNCEIAAPTNATSCVACGASFAPELDRQYFGLMPVRLLPGQATADVVAASALSGSARATPEHAAPAPTASAPAAPTAPTTHATSAQSGPTPTAPTPRPPAPAYAPRSLLEDDFPANDPAANDPATDPANNPDAAGGGASMGRGLKTTLVLLLVGVAVVMSATLFVTLAPLAGIALPDWVPTYAKLVASDSADDSGGVAPAGTSASMDKSMDNASESTASNTTNASGPSAPPAGSGSAPSESIAEEPASTIPSPANATPIEGNEGLSAQVAQIRSLLGSDSKDALARAFEAIDALPADEPITAILRKAAQDLRLIRSISGTL